MKKNNIFKLKNKDLEEKNETIETNIKDEELDIEDIEMELDKFYINKSIFDEIEIPRDLGNTLNDIIEKADKDNQRLKIKKVFRSIASIIIVAISVGIYNPALAYKIPFIQIILQNINDKLNIDEITNKSGIDKIIPKVELDEGKLEIIKPNVTKEKDVIIPTNDYATINLIHQMANSIIKADKIWGYTEITPKTIDIALSGINKMDDGYEKEYLRNSIELWNNGKFSNAKEVHNYVWKLLGGTIGEATGINNIAIKKIKDKYFEY